MLHKLLQLIHAGQAHSPQDLAMALNVPQPIITPMINQLTQQGYLVEEQTCTDTCNTCAAGCERQQALHFWALTEKGERALR